MKEQEQYEKASKEEKIELDKKWFQKQDPNSKENEEYIKYLGPQCLIPRSHDELPPMTKRPLHLPTHGFEVNTEDVKVNTEGVEEKKAQYEIHDSREAMVIEQVQNMSFDRILELR